MQQPNYSITDLAASQRASRAPLARPFRANIGGAFRAPRDPYAGQPSTRATDAAAERVAKAKRAADKLRADHQSYRNRCGTFI